MLDKQSQALDPSTPKLGTHIKIAVDQIGVDEIDDGENKADYNIITGYGRID